MTLSTELEGMKSLFATIEDAVGSIRDGNQDEMIESSDALRAEDEALLRNWGGRWARVFQRKGAVEESWVREELARPIPEPEVREEIMKDEPLKMDEGQGQINGGAAVNGGNADELDGIE